LVPALRGGDLSHSSKGRRGAERGKRESRPEKKKAGGVRRGEKKPIRNLERPCFGREKHYSLKGKGEAFSLRKNILRGLIVREGREGPWRRKAFDSSDRKEYFTLLRKVT